MPTYNSPDRALRSTRQTRVGHTHADLSPTAPFDDNPKWKLFITTSSKICAWDCEGCEPIFTSSSRGIVTAKRSLDGSVLAIADAQVVILRKIEDGQDKPYRLRGTQRCRLLQYSHDSRNLFYADSLHNSVQSYSLSDNRVADAARSHPSPITAFTVSCDSNLIISASSKPPTIQIHSQMMATTIQLVPSASSAPVVTCAFHPSRKHLFLLAFGDGVLAAFDYTKLSPAKTRNKKENARLAATRCHARGIHAFRHLHNPSVAGAAGITGAGFVPGQRSRAVTVGEDGRCFLVDFEKGDTLGSWHIGAPATGLTIREIDAAGQGKEELGGYFIAVGTVHGRCLVYDGNGNKVAERVIDAEGESILDMEWVCGDVSEVDMAPVPASPDKTASKKQPKKSERSRKSTNALQSQKPNMSSSPVAPAEEEEEGDTIVVKEVLTRRQHRGFSPAVYDSLKDTADQGYMMLFSPVKRNRVSKSSSLPGKNTEKSRRPPEPRACASTQSSDHRSVVSAPQLWGDEVADGGETKEEEAEVQLAEPDSISIFQGNVQKDITTAEESNSNNASISGGLSSVRTDRIKLDERTDDGRILSEIRSIRALYSGKSKSAPTSEELAAQPAPRVPPTKGRSTPASRVGRESLDVSSVKRSTSAPEKKIHASELCTSDAEESAHPSVTESTGGDSREADTQEEQAQLPSQSDGAPEEAATGEGEDIWAALAVGKRAGRLGRKRKKAPVDEESIVVNTLPDPSRSSTARPSKSRKTVSWSEDHEPQADVFPTPIASSSAMGLYGGEGSTSSRSHLGLRPLAVISGHRNNDSSRIIASTTAAGAKATPTRNGGDVDEIVRAAVGQMQAAMTQQIGALQAEMHRQFRAQHDELQWLRSEMTRVREENQKLRGALIQSTGVGESATMRSGSG